MKFLFFLECKIGLIPFIWNAHFHRWISILTLFTFSLGKKIKGPVRPYAVVQLVVHHVLLRHVAELLVRSPAKDGNSDKLINIFLEY